MSFQYKESDKRGNPTIKYVAGDWIVQYSYYTSLTKIKAALKWCETRNSLIYHLQRDYLKSK